MKTAKIGKMFGKVIIAFFVIFAVFGLLLKLEVISFNSKELPLVIKLNDYEIGLRKGETFKLNPLVLPTDTYHFDLVFTSSNEEIISIDQDGVITAHQEGDAIITIKTSINDLEATCLVHVEEERIFTTGVQLLEEKVSLQIGMEYSLNYNVLPENANTYNFSFQSSDDEILTIDNGTVMAQGAGEAFVIVKDNQDNLLDTVLFSIYEKQDVNAKEILLSRNNINLVRGGTFQLNADLLGDNVDAITWSSVNNSVASVNENGKIKGINLGETYIIATLSSGISAYAKVNVIEEKKALENIQITQDDLTLSLFEESQLEVEFTPTDATNQSVTWNSRNEKILKVSENGVLIPVGVGETVVTVTSADGSFEDSIKVKVVLPNKVGSENSISFENDEVNLTVFGSFSLNRLFNSNEIFNYTSQDTSILKVYDGVVLALKEGEANVQIKTSRGFNKEVKFVIKNVSVSDIILDKTKEDLKIGDTVLLNTLVMPSNATFKKLLWESADPTVAYVNSFGEVKALKEGRTLITVKTLDGTKAKECVIEVTN